MIRQEEELKERVRFMSALGQMAITIAHEMRNFLGSIELCAEMLALELKGDPQRGELVQTLIEGIHALNGILTNLLTFARPCQPSLARVALHAVLDETLAYSRYALKEQQITLVKAYAASDPTIWADKELLKQVFLNLILNAVQAMPHGGTLTITTRVARGVEVGIADTGCGIPPELLDRIFEPFFTTKARGTGLGLTLVRRILDRHRATISVESEPGRGTVFTIVFPGSWT